jgi:molybdopterin converting factor small subunit
VSVESKHIINLSFFGPIIGIVGRSNDELVVSADQVSVKEVIEGLCEKYGQKFEEIALNKGELNSGLIIFVNGRHISDPSFLIAPPKGDELQLMIASQMKGG